MEVPSKSSKSNHLNIKILKQPINKFFILNRGTFSTHLVIPDVIKIITWVLGPCKHSDRFILRVNAAGTGLHNQLSSYKKFMYLSGFTPLHWHHGGELPFRRRKNLSCVCSQKVIACFTSPSVVNRFRARYFLRGPNKLKSPNDIDSSEDGP